MSCNAYCLKGPSIDDVKVDFSKGFSMWNDDVMHFWDGKGFEGWHVVNFPYNKVRYLSLMVMIMKIYKIDGNHISFPMLYNIDSLF